MYEISYYYYFCADQISNDVIHLAICSRHRDPLVIQIAFQYSIVVPNEMQNDAGLVSAARYDQ